MRLLDDQVRLAAGLLLHVLGRALGRDERRAQERLELDVAGDLGLELLDAVGELGPLAPDVLEAVGDLLDRLLDARAPVPEEAASQLAGVCTSTGVSGIASPPCQRTLSMSAFTSIPQRCTATMTADDRREVERPERRDHAPEQPQVGLADVVQELLHALERRRGPPGIHEARMYAKISRT